MTHPDDGILQSLVDGELSQLEAAEVRTHLDACSECATRLEGLRDERRLLADALVAPTPDPARVRAARQAVLARANGAGIAPVRSAWWRGSLARAAGLVLALAGAASAAIPGSPVRVWLEQRLDPVPPEPVAVEVEAGTEPTVAIEPEEALQEAGIQLGVEDGPLTVSITGLAPGARVEVLLVDADHSGVYAAAGARFSTTPGGLQAHVDGEYVRVELARSLEGADVEVDGSLYLRKQGDRLELPGPGSDSTEAHFRFQVPQSVGPER